MRHVQGLRVDIAIHFQGEDLAEACGIHICGSEYRLRKDGAGPRVVVLRGQDLGIPEWMDQEQECDAEPQSKKP